MADASSATPREMPLLLGPHAKTGAPEMLLLIGVPDTSGVVHVRSWSAENWSSPPRTRAERAIVLLEWLERQATMGRTMNQSIYAVRQWLHGEGSASR
jgi:hypothetical protein